MPGAISRIKSSLVDWKPFGSPTPAPGGIQTEQNQEATPESVEETPTQQVQAYGSYGDGFGPFPGNWTAVGSFSFDGEKVPGEIGTIKQYYLSYRRLSMRGWQSFLESDIVQAVLRKYIRWVIGSGLKLQAEPVMEIINGAAGSFNKVEFVKQTETRFKLWAKSKRASHDKQMSLNKLMSEIKKHAIVAGDCLVYLRSDEMGNVSVQLIDGMRVATPVLSLPELREDQVASRVIKYGIVFDENGEHLAYYVKDVDLGYIRIPARDQNGMLVAWLYYGLRYRIDNCRGIPLHTAILQTVAQLDRYKEAAVGSAEEQAKVVYSVTHDKEGTGENIHTKNIKGAIQQGLNKRFAETQQYWDDNYGNLIAKTTNKQVPNLPPGAKLEALSTQNNLNFSPFMMGNLTILCATLQMPVEVALSKYDSNFSASRAAYKDWEHNLNVEREEDSENGYMPIYQYWLTLQVMTDKIQAQPLMQAVANGDQELFEAVTNGRFIGTPVPHIDPVKEVQAERLKLGESAKSVPLTTPSLATETLGTGEYSENKVRFEEEVEGFATDPTATQESISEPVNDDDDDRNDDE